MRKVAILVTGDRHATTDMWWKTLCSVFNLACSVDDEVVAIHGDAHGIDSLADRYFRLMGQVSIEALHADWQAHGRAAGPIRNKAMLDRLLMLRDEGYETQVLAFHDDIANSKGTGNMVKQARAAGVPVTAHRSDGSVA